MEAYVEKAIDAGTEYFGFSEHAPMYFDEKYRMRFEDMPRYAKAVRSLAQRYRNQITVLLGLEVDFLPGYMDDRVLHADVDYLIGSVHFIDKWGFDNPEFIGEYQNRDIDTIWQEYFDAIEAMAKSGYFDIVGHLDLIKVFNYLPRKDIRLIAKKALDAIKAADMVVELNMAGYRKPVQEAYPSRLLLEEIYARDIPVTFGSDAHKPEQVSLFADELVNLAKSIGFEKCAIFCNRDKQLLNF